MIAARFIAATAMLMVAACAPAQAGLASNEASAETRQFMADRTAERVSFRAAVRGYILLFGGCPRIEVPEDRIQFEALNARFSDLRTRYLNTPLSFDFDAAINDANYLNAQTMATIRCSLSQREPNESDRQVSKNLLKRARAGLEQIEAAGALALEGAN